MASETETEALLRRERAIAATGLALVCALAWGYVLAGAGTGMSVAAMTTWQFPPPDRMAFITPWSMGTAVVMFFMWWIMMIAMMTPSAAPLILLYARAYRYEQRFGRLPAGRVPTRAFALGYLLAWALFSAGATLLQWGLERAGLVHQMMMWSIAPSLTAALLVAAGLYQLTPLKAKCLTLCRSPADFLARNFAPGASGALRMGLRHGYYCLACCSALMALLFAGGIMNLVWIAGLTIYVSLEKLAPAGRQIAHTAGLVLIAGGIWVGVRAWAAA